MHIYVLKKTDNLLNDLSVITSLPLASWQLMCLGT